MKKVLIVVCVFIITSCKEAKKDFPRLTEYELAELKSYEVKLRESERMLSAYKLEKQRINEITPQYLKDYVKLSGFSVFKTNRFDDGRERACYQGRLINSGNEIIEKLDLIVEFYSSSGEKIKKWEAQLVAANDEYLDKGDFDKTKALVLSVSGRKLPLKPKHELNLKENRNCMSEVFLGWSESNIQYNLTGLVLRTKLSEVTASDLVNFKIKMLDLKERAEANGQI